MGAWFQPKSMPWWAGIGPLIAGILQLYSQIHMAIYGEKLGLLSVVLDAGLDGTPAFALIWLGCVLLWANIRYWPAAKEWIDAHT